MLRDFYHNEYLRNEVQEYLISYLKERAIEKVFDKEDVSAIAEAKEIIDDAFDNLGVMFKQEPKKNTVDEAR